MLEKRKCLIVLAWTEICTRVQDFFSFFSNGLKPENAHNSECHTVIVLICLGELFQNPDSSSKVFMSSFHFWKMYCAQKSIPRYVDFNLMCQKHSWFRYANSSYNFYFILQMSCICLSDYHSANAGV